MTAAPDNDDGLSLNLVFDAPSSSSGIAGGGSVGVGGVVGGSNNNKRPKRKTKYDRRRERGRAAKAAKEEAKRQKLGGGPQQQQQQQQQSGGGNSSVGASSLAGIAAAFGASATKAKQPTPIAKEEGDAKPKVATDDDAAEKNDRGTETEEVKKAAEPLHALDDEEKAVANTSAADSVPSSPTPTMLPSIASAKPAASSPMEDTVSSRRHRVSLIHC